MSNIRNFELTQHSQAYLLGQFSIDTLHELKQAQKILFSGSDTEAKQVALRTVSDIPVQHIDVKHAEQNSSHQLDYGYLSLDGETNLYLYGITTAATQDMLWDQLYESGLGLVLIMDNQRPSALADLAVYLDAFADLIKRSCVVVGITHLDEANSSLGLSDYQAFLSQRDYVVPVFELDPHQPNDIKVLLQAMLHVLDN